VSEARLRVAIFTESYLPYLSGVTISTEALARGLVADGHDVLLVAPRPARGAAHGTAGAAGPEPRIAWLPSIQLPPPAPPGYRIPARLWSGTLRQAIDFDPQIVHAHSPFVSGWMARRVAERVGAPLVFTHHTRFTDYRHYLGPLARPGAAAMDAHLRRFWSACAAVIAPGSDLAAEITDRLAGPPPPRVVWIPTGIEVGDIATMPPADPRALAGWPADSLVIVSLGRLAREKSVDLLLDAFRVAAELEGRLRLLLVGGGPRRAALEARAHQLGLARRVHLTGSLPRAEALALVRGADLFAFASHTETQGLVVAEALACGLPVVAVDAPGTHDAVRPGIDGVLVPAASLGSALAELAADPRRRAEMATAAAAGAARFDRARRIGEVVKLYRQLLREHR
jgi:1,2-diacylglycerol 3-alpha-glucosyltransferase